MNNNCPISYSTVHLLVFYFLFTGYSNTGNRPLQFILSMAKDSAHLSVLCGSWCNAKAALFCTSVQENLKVDIAYKNNRLTGFQLSLLHYYNPNSHFSLSLIHVSNY